MKKVITAIFLIILFLNSCSNIQKKIYIKIEGDIASPSFPIKINVSNIDEYILKFYDKNNNEISFRKDNEKIYFLNLKEGKNNIKMNVVYKNKVIQEKTFSVYYDNTSPDISFLNYYIRNGELNITASSNATDLEKFILKTDNNSYEFNINFSLPIKKNNGVLKYELYAKDKYNNISEPKIIEIDTNKDEPPQILSQNLDISIYGNTNIKVLDDWTPVNEIKLILKTEKNIYSLINIDEVLLDNSKEGTLIAIDNGDNRVEKKVNIKLEKDLPSIPTGNPRLIDFSIDTFGWNYETDSYSYIVETPYLYGWKQNLETKAAFARVTESNVAMIREKSQFSTLSFPSYPTIRFSGTFVHLVRNILESSEENLYLPQINSEFLIGGKTVLGEKSVVMVESGSVLKFVSNSQLIIKGLFFIMPGAGKSLISGNGEIIVDGGILIASKTIFDKVRIIGNKAKLIYLEDSEFLEGSDILSTNDFRICLYNNLGYNSNLNFHNSEEIYIKDSSFKNITLYNINKLEVIKSSFNNLIVNGLSKIFLNNSIVNTITQKNFSWSKFINSNINKLLISNYSKSVIYNSEVESIESESSVVIK
ncbi:hypothetical protein [Marinitoga sp. 38H-ov]|uniref:hypothetical protein n=1 Tax=Marinitoga sp. 38H-ov TaxID=1755814 RepID=UPI0013EC638D|nr:hypothetical protein [Marinitoga sp. 38H-ov]KAF2955692.1 hypothetical protein AS160_00845 [Marinitoga sp. 38H-ov]